MTYGAMQFGLLLKKFIIFMNIEFGTKYIFANSACAKVKSTLKTF